MLESAVEKKLKKAVERLGGLTFKFESSGNSGVPDRIVIVPGGRVWFVELKKPKGGRVSKLQEYQMGRLSRMGANVRVVKDEETLAKLLGEITADGI